MVAERLGNVLLVELETPRPPQLLQRARERNPAAALHSSLGHICLLQRLDPLQLAERRESVISTRSSSLASLALLSGNFRALQRLGGVASDIRRPPAHRREREATEAAKGAPSLPRV